MGRSSGARARQLREALDQVWCDDAPAPRRCDFPGCGKNGDYKAPKAPDRLNEHYWFCLEHVRAYNRAWNYCRGMSESEIEHTIRRATTWERPSWPFGARCGDGADVAGAAVRDDLGVLDDGAAAPRRTGSAVRTPPEQVRALAVLGLAPPATLEDVKTRYKRLVKMTHPDRNGGDREAEERLKSINEAYTTVKRFLG